MRTITKTHTGIIVSDEEMKLESLRWRLWKRKQH